MKLSEFDFPLPESLIAQHPLPERDQSRMMVVDRNKRRWEHRIFRELPDLLDSRHLLVFNTTKVFPARLRASRPGKKEAIEVLLVREEAPSRWNALIRPARKAPLDGLLAIGGVTARVLEVRDSGSRLLEFEQEIDLMSLAEKIGEPPLPPYIRRNVAADFTEDRIRYQTIYAGQRGSVAAPTAGLHFTLRVLQDLAARGVGMCDILLHVGYGTFQPVRVE